MTSDMVETKFPALFILLIDHDNVPISKFDINAMLKSWLQVLPTNHAIPSICHLQVRSYGGWFEGSNSSPSRFESAQFYQQNCPAILRVNGVYFRVTFSFADDLLATRKSLMRIGQTKITHTVTSRSSKKEFVVNRKQLICSDPQCEISNTRRWIRGDKSCFKLNCAAIFSDNFHRLEQKQVDVHLASDLLTIATGGSVFGKETIFVAVASDDLDLIPALASASSLADGRINLCAMRFSTKASYLDHEMVETGVVMANVP